MSSLHSRSTATDVITLRANIARAAMPMPGMPVSSPPLPVYVLGDFNARHETWEPTAAEQKDACSLGRIVHRQLVAPQATRAWGRGRARETQLTLLNTMFTTSRYTPTREETGSVIDLALTTHPHTVSAMHVVSDAGIGSDHWPIMISIPRISPNAQGAIPMRRVRPSEDSIANQGSGARPPSPSDMENKYNEELYAQHVPSPSPHARPSPSCE